jgi:hypothetical protein
MVIQIRVTTQKCMVGKRTRRATCEKCRVHYYYDMVRAGVGAGESGLFLGRETARDEADINARISLQEQLEEDCDIVPCPYCGWLQADMVAKLRKGKHRWLHWVGGLISCGAFGATWLFLGLALHSGWLGFAGGVAAGYAVWFAVLAFRSSLAKRWDPNQPTPGTSESS